MIKKETLYVTHTCYVCQVAFVDIDDYDAQDFPPTHKACAVCTALGYSYHKKDVKQKNISEQQLPLALEV